MNETTIEAINGYPILAASEWFSGEGVRDTRIILVRYESNALVTAMQCRDANKQADEEWLGGRYFPAGALVRAAQSFEERVESLRWR